MNKTAIRICATLFILGIFGIVLSYSISKEHWQLVSDISFGLCGLGILISIWSIK